MNVKRLLVLYSGLAIASTMSALVVYAQINQPREVPAFSYDMQFFVYDETGAKNYTHTDQYAVRGDGSTAMVDDSLLRTMGERRVAVRDYQRREAWTTSFLGRTVTTLPMQERERPAVHHEKCDEGEVDSFGRYQIRKDRRIMRNPETDELIFIVERWRAPELGCVPVRVVRYGKDEKPTHDRAAINIVIGEPNPTLFQVPDGYLESSPLQAQRKLVDLGFYRSPPIDETGGMEAAERRYWTTR